MAHFYNKGQKTCTFRELKQFVTFHGTRKEGRVYVTVNITNPNLYIDLLRLDNPNMQETIAEYVYKAKYQKSESEVKRKANIAAKHAIKAFMKAIDQKIEEVYKTYWYDFPPENAKSFQNGF